MTTECGKRVETVKHSGSNQHFNQFTISDLFCVILCYVILLPLEKMNYQSGFSGEIVMIKYVLCLVTVLLLVVDAFICFDLKKCIKVHESELVENHIKGLLGRAVAMTVISVCVGVIAIVLQLI
jgi:amino acid transporter